MEVNMTNTFASISPERDKTFDETSIDSANELNEKRVKAERLARASSKCPFGTGRARLLQAASLDTSQNGYGFKLMVNIISFVAVLFAICFLLGVPAKALFYILSCNIIVFALGLRTLKEELKGMLFIIERRPYRIDDLIEIDPPEASVSLDEEYTWRVDNFNLFYTDLVCLGNGRRTSFCNQNLADKRIMNWCRVPVSFQILLKVPVGSCNALLFLRDFHAKIEQYANDNPNEWFVVETSIDDAIKDGDEYKEYLVEIRHRESWQHYEFVLRSKSQLTRYCLEQLRKVGDDNKGSGEDNADCDDTDKIKVNYTEEKKEEQGGVSGDMEEEQEAKNGSDDGVRRINYRIFVG